MGTVPKTQKIQHILDAAKVLFTHHSYDSVTTRQIAAETHVDLVPARHHFGKKRDLFDAVLLRRTEVLNDAQLTAPYRCQVQTGHIDKLSGEKCRASDLNTAYDYMIPFVAAGFQRGYQDNRS